MQYNPKLKMAMEEIKAIVDKYGIAAIAFLHLPGHGEYLVKLDPKYSCAFVDKGKLRIKAASKDPDYEQKVRDTSNMLKILCDTCAPILMGMMDASKMVDAIANAQHSGPGHTSHDQQNN